MKLPLFRYFILLIAAGAVISSCNKGAVKAPATTNDAAIEAQQKQQTIQLGIDLYKSISGQYGGVKVGNGIQASKAKNITNSYIPLQCGLTISTPVDYGYTSNDTSFYTKGLDLFTYTCDTAGYNGDINNNKYYSTVKSASATDSTNVAENFTVAEVNHNPYFTITNGTMATDQNFTYFNQPPYQYFGKTETVNIRDYKTAYTLATVSVNSMSGSVHITSGVVSFNSTVSIMDKNNWPLGAYSSTGTIAFEGFSDLAIITAYYPYNQRTFTVTINIITGQVVPG